MQLIKQTQKKYLKKNIPDLMTGDVIRVHQKIKEGNKSRIQIFDGIVIKKSGGKSLDATFTVRRKSFGVGVEITFALHSPLIVKIEKTKRINVQKSKLYYLRELTDKQIKRKGEFKEFIVWEEAKGKEEEEKEKARKEAEAKAKEEEKIKKQEELEKKFESVRGKEESKKDTNLNKKENDSSEKKTGE